MPFEDARPKNSGTTEALPVWPSDWFKGDKKSYQQSCYIPPAVAGADIWTVFTP
jgi:hypothetical protein